MDQDTTKQGTGVISEVHNVQSTRLPGEKDRPHKASRHGRHHRHLSALSIRRTEALVSPNHRSLSTMTICDASVVWKVRVIPAHHARSGLHRGIPDGPSKGECAIDSLPLGSLPRRTHEDQCRSLKQVLHRTFTSSSVLAKSSLRTARSKM